MPADAVEPASARRVVIGQPPGLLAATAANTVDFRIVDAIRQNVGPTFTAGTGADLPRLPFVARAVCRALAHVPAMNGHQAGIHLALATLRSQVEQTAWPVIANAAQKRAKLLGLEAHYPGLPEADPTFVVGEFATSVDPRRLATLTIEGDHSHTADLRLTYDPQRCSANDADLFLSHVQAALHSADWHHEF